MKGMLAGATLAIGGVLVGFAFATQTDVEAEAKWWELMTAFGTVGAVVVAIYFSLRDALRKRESEELSAEIAQARIAPELGQLLFALSSAVWSAQKLALVEENEPRSRSDIYLLSRLAECLSLPLSSLQCELLLPAKPDHARQLSAILGEAVRVKEAVSTVVGFGDSQPNSGGLTTLMLVQGICELGALVNAYLGKEPPREFKLETFRNTARKLGVEEVWGDRGAPGQQGPSPRLAGEREE